MVPDYWGKTRLTELYSCYCIRCLFTKNDWFTVWTAMSFKFANVFLLSVPVCCLFFFLSFFYRKFANFSVLKFTNFPLFFFTHFGDYIMYDLNHCWIVVKSYMLTFRRSFWVRIEICAHRLFIDIACKFVWNRSFF